MDLMRHNNHQLTTDDIREMRAVFDLAKHPLIKSDHKALANRLIRLQQVFQIGCDVQQMKVKIHELKICLEYINKVLPGTDKNRKLVVDLNRKLNGIRG